MRVRFHKNFVKTYERLRHIKDQTDARVLLFTKEPFHPLLDNHPLHGEFKGYRSINITGDYRAVYEPLEGDVALFKMLGTHSELYGK